MMSILIRFKLTDFQAHCRARLELQMKCGALLSLMVLNTHIARLDTIPPRRSTRRHQSLTAYRMPAYNCSSLS